MPPEHDLRLSGSPVGDDPLWPESRVNAWAWAFIGVGVLLRMVRYALGHPLWGDEGFLAENLISRDFAGLMRPLDYVQVCPLLFLWVEKAMILAFGISVWSLRLIPTVASIAGLFLARHVAYRLLKGPAVVLALAFLAVGFYPIRHGGEVKPYSMDFLVSLGLIALAVEWLRAPGRDWPLWALAGLGPVVIGVSNPSIFVASAVGIVLLVPVLRTRRATAILALALYGLLTLATFGLLLRLVTAAQSASVMGTMRDYWATGFPPRGALPLLRWLVEVHTSHMFSYPAGGDHGASSLTSLLCLVAVVALLRRGSRLVLALLLAPFALGLLAAFVEKYPYGGSARTMQYVAPAILLLAGLGGATLLARIGSISRRMRIERGTLGLLVAVGAGMLAFDFAHPYKEVYDRETRDFARRFWAEISADGEVACARTDLGVPLDPMNWRGDRSAVYLCHRAIYGGLTAPTPPRLDRVSASHPLRAVVFGEKESDRPAVEAWLERMDREFVLRARREMWVNKGVSSRAGHFEDHYVVYEFVPRDVAARSSGSTPR